MVLSALENTWLMLFAILLMFRTQVTFFFRCVTGNPIVLFCFGFVVLFGFSIGISTPNFGALVRFKIPLVPMLVSCMYIVNMLNKKRLEAKRKGMPFDLHAYRKGEPAAAQQQRAGPGRVFQSGTAAGTVAHA